MKKRGASLKRIHVWLSLLAILLSGVFASMTISAQINYDEVQRVTDGYVSTTKYLYAFDEESDNLTDYARSYASTGDKTALDNYFSSLYEEKNRESFVASVKTYFEGTSVYEGILNALGYSDELALIEMYALRLAAYGYHEETLPPELSEVEISSQDQALSDEEKLSKARSSLFDQTYQRGKAKINSAIEDSLNDLVLITDQKRSGASNRLEAALLVDYIILPLLLLSLFADIALTFVLVLKPIQKAKEGIAIGEEAPISGSQEVRFLTESYNEMLSLRNQQKKELEYEVSHDILTGIPNRHEYIAKTVEFAHDELYYVIADIDHFKQINDTHGHAKGDQVLSEFARRLRETFLNHDLVFRIGGDEFVVLIKTDEDIKEKLSKKLKEINRTFAIMAERYDFPKVTASFGVAKKSKTMTFEEAYRLADAALYSIKGTDVDFAFSQQKAVDN